MHVKPEEYDQGFSEWLIEYSVCTVGDYSLISTNYTHMLDEHNYSLKGYTQQQNEAKRILFCGLILDLYKVSICIA